MKPLNIPRFSRRERGFALVVTLSLMILLTVIAVGLLQLSSVSLRASSQGDARALARSNAMMALQMAIGQLQRTAGPDQRITGPAKLASADYQASWAGVWTPGMLDATGLMPPVAPTTDGRRNYLVDARVQPPNSNWKFDWFIEPLVSPNANGSSPSVDIKYPIGLGLWSAGVPVLAPEVKVGTTGGIAWWTQDLSQQASLASGVNAAEAAEVGLSAAPRVDTSQIAGGKLPIDSFDTTSDRRKVTSVQGAYLAGGTKREDTPKNLEDSGTERSFGLFTDPVKGGFKADMTRFVESPTAVMGQLPAMGLTGITAKSSILPGTHHIRTGPQWERLRKWYNLPGAATRRLTGTDPTVVRAVPDSPVPDSPGAVAGEGFAVDAVRSNDMPLHPVVVDAGFHWDFTPFPNTVAVTSIRVHILPRLTLWNPYNAKLISKRYVFAMPKQIDSYGGLTVKMKTPSGVESDVDVIDGRGEQFRTSSALFLDRKDSYFLFTVKATSFEPGECLVFTPETAPTGAPYDSGNPANNVLTASQAIGLQNFYINKTPLPDKPGTPGLQTRLAARDIVTSYKIGSIANDNMNWRSMPFFLKAAPARGALAADRVLTDSTYPTLQRLYLTHAGGGFNPGFISVAPGWNDDPLNSGSGWEVFNADRKLPRTWNYRHHLSWIDDITEKNAAGSQPPYTTALMADWNPLASVACRTPSTFMEEYFDLHTGCWYLCKAILGYDANGPDNTWGFLGPDNKAHGCPYGNPLSHRSELSFPLIDIPDPSLPLQSIGILRNVPLSPWTWHPVKPIGSSRTSLHSDKKATAIKAIADQDNPWTSILTTFGAPNFNDIIQSADSTGEILLYDLAFEANRELWDGTFASSWSQAAAWKGTDPLPNRQYAAHPQQRDAKSARERADSSSSKDTYGLWLPAYLLANEGAFNVNSTSPTAWAAVLGGLKKLVRKDAADNTVAGDHPFAKFRKPASSDPTWGGGLGLSDAQLTTLATKIVDIVKERGPFLGVADFVNRRLADNPSGNRGALEEALSRASLANPILKASEAVSNDYGTKVPSPQKGRYENVSKFLMEGAAGYIEQADLLEPLGGSLCARGDTFRIRASGASYDKSGKLLSRVTCEAIVIRSPDYLIAAAIDQAGSPGTGNSALIPPTRNSGTQWIPNPALNPINQKFGRRFEVLNIKWLTSVNEI